MAHIYNINLPLSGGGGGIDTSKDTVTAETMLAGVTAHDASGEQIEGTIPTYEGSITEGATEGAQIKYDEGFADGKKSEYDAFWDSFQTNGDLIYCDYLFAGQGWNADIFKPKHPIRPKSAYCMFANSSIPSLVGVDISFAGCTNMERAFYASKIKHLGVVDCRALTTIVAVLNNVYAVSATIILRDNGDQGFANTFNYSYELEDLMVEGTIGQNGFNTSWSPLSKASLTSIVNAMSSTTTGLTVTLRLDAVKKAFETSEGANDGNTSDEWTALAATKPNWTINLING